VIDTTDATFKQDVLQASVPVVVEFTAPWCKPCRAIEPWLESLEERYEGRLLVARLDIDANLGVPGRYGVLSLPTVMVFSGGEPGETVHGAQPRRRYDEAAERALAGTAS
jgi:thioredoxin 1